MCSLNFGLLQLFGPPAVAYREGNGTPLQYSCLENPRGGGAWWAAVRGVAEGWTRLHFHFHALKKEMATHSSVLAWRIPGMAEPGGLPSTGSHRVGHDWSDAAAAAAAIASWSSTYPGGFPVLHSSHCTEWPVYTSGSPIRSWTPESWDHFCLVCHCILRTLCHQYWHLIVYQFSSVQSLSRVRLFATPWIAAHQASLSIINSWSSLKLTSIESVMPSSHLILCCPLLLLPPIPPSIRVFSNESTLGMRWPKYWSFQLQHQSFQWTPRTDLL